MMELPAMVYSISFYCFLFLFLHNFVYLFIFFVNMLVKFYFVVGKQNKKTNKNIADHVSKWAC